MAYYYKISLTFFGCLSFYLIFVKYSAVLYNSYYMVEGRIKERPQEIYENPTMDLLVGDFLINTPGCYIPNYALDLKFISPQRSNETCGQRAIFVKAVGSDKIVFKIDKAQMEKYVVKKRKFQCCYRFATRPKAAGRLDSRVTYSKCIPFKDGTKVKLLQEVITVSCVAKINKKTTEDVYEDAYIIIKKKDMSKRKIAREQSWNVLILGMAAMSRARLYNTMPQTVRYLREHSWLDYKGYQKMAYNTFPNLMSVQTEQNLSPDLQPTCGDHVWNMLKTSDYITAYGEDLHLLSHTLHHLRYINSSAEHVIRPLFLTGEYRVGNLVCTKKLPSANHLIDYAYQFIHTYRHQNFFGMFWINSNSYSPLNIPSLIDHDIVDFLKKLNKTQILNDTFIYFLSDNGMRFGTIKNQIQSYYEERLPMLFMWVPSAFRKLNIQLYDNLKVNQNRLVTEYDLYNTLADLLEMSIDSTTGILGSKTWQKLQGLFIEQPPNRTCADAGIDEKSCSCHNMTEVNPKNIGAKLSLALAVSYIINKAKSIKTIPCMQCYNFNLKTVLRTHFYKNGTVIYYVIAFQMSPGDTLYEATVENNGKTFKIIQPIYSLTSYNTRGNCVINPIDRAYCVCQVTECT